MRILIFTVVIMLFVRNSEAKEAFVLTSDSQDESLSERYLELFIDSSGQLNENSILVVHPKEWRSELRGVNFKKYNFWLRLSIHNKSQDSKWLIELMNFDIEEVLFFDITRNSRTETGASKKFSTRSIQHKNFAFDAAIDPGETKTYLIKVCSSDSFYPILKVRPYSYFIEYATKEYIMLGIYYGLLLFIVCYNFFIYLSIKDISYVFYLFYTLSIGLNSLQWDGLGFEYIWPNIPFVNTLLKYSSLILLLTFCAYAIHFLELHKKNRPFYFLTLILVTLYLLLFIINSFLPIPFFQFYYLITYTFLCVVSLYIFIKGEQSILFFVIGNIIIVVSQIAHFLVLNGTQIENNLLVMFLVYSLNFGFVIEAFIFSIAISDKLRWLKLQKEEAQLHFIEQLKLNDELKDKVNKELALKVAERTRELEDTKMLLQDQAEKINKMNQQLDLENYKLKSDVKEITRERGLLKLLTFIEFKQAFPNENACYRFIEELKWGDGFVCRKCGNEKYTRGNELYSRRCTKCSYIETIRANTIFHNSKFQIDKAFQLIYLFLTSETDISSYKLANILNLQQKTCLSFRQKIMDKLKSDNITKKEIMEKGWGILIKI